MTRMLRYGMLSLFLLKAFACAAQPAIAPDRAAAYACRDVAAQVEREFNLPTGLMLAIGRQESGRRVSDANEFLPFPFAVDAVGESRFFASEQEAIAYVAKQQEAGVRSIDVGCFQINLQAHPTAFATLHDGFDPLSNGRYAAGFLRALRDQGGSWEEAVAHYHSFNPEFGNPYMAAVLRRWGGADTLPTSSSGIVIPTVARGAQIGSVRIAGVIVQRPSGALAHVVSMVSARRRLPKVFSPGG